MASPGNAKKSPATKTLLTQHLPSRPPSTITSTVLPPGTLFTREQEPANTHTPLYIKHGAKEDESEDGAAAGT
jgi:hypothetical protein